MKCIFMINVLISKNQNIKKGFLFSINYVSINQK